MTESDSIKIVRLEEHYKAISSDIGELKNNFNKNIDELKNEIKLFTKEIRPIVISIPLEVNDVKEKNKDLETKHENLIGRLWGLVVLVIATLLGTIASFFKG